MWLQDIGVCRVNDIFVDQVHLACSDKFREYFKFLQKSEEAFQRFVFVSFLKFVMVEFMRKVHPVYFAELFYEFVHIGMGLLIKLKINLHEPTSQFMFDLFVVEMY